MDSGGSVLAAVVELKERGAENITVACTHAIMSGTAWQKFASLHAQAGKEGWKFNFVGTSTIEHHQTPAWYHTFRIEKLLATIVQKINSRGSVSQVHRERE